MALIRCGNVAFDWSRVYAVRVLNTDFNNHVDRVAIFVDQPGVAIGTSTLEVDHALAERIWKRAANDPRLTVFKTSEPIALDMSKVCAIVRDGEKRTASFTLDFGTNRSGTLKLDADAANVILDALEQG